MSEGGGDSHEARFTRLLGEFGPSLDRLAAAYEAEPAERDDLLQDISFALWRALPSFRGESSTRTFVARIAQFRAVSHVAARVRVPAGTSLDDAAVIAPGPLPDAQAIAANQRERLLEAVRRLPIAYRDAVILTLEDFTPAEIADVLGVRANVVSIRLTRARTLLRAWLREAS
jgi:RNA polymerase sigma-70 factor (ECF subfamily)